MTKLTIEAVEQASKQIGLTDEARRELVAMLADMTADENDGPKTPPVKKQYCILVSDPLGVMPDSDLVGWVLQIPESESPATTEERIRQAVYDHNVTKRGRQYPVQTVGEACEHVKARHFKEHGVWVKTKTPVLVLRTDNEIPNTESLLGNDRGTPNENANP
jgi:hypothetical protein